MDNLSELFTTAGTLMLAGMCFVFLFLGVLVVIINYVLTPLSIKFPDPVIQPNTSRPASAKSKTTGVTPQVVAAISSAVSSYRKNNNSK